MSSLTAAALLDALTAEGNAIAADMQWILREGDLRDQDQLPYLQGLMHANSRAILIVTCLATGNPVPEPQRYWGGPIQ